MRARFPSVLLLLGALSIPATAQLPAGAAGFRWTGASGNTAGTLCFGFQCAPHATGVSGGEAVTLLVTGELNAFYFVGVSASAGLCFPLPGILNSLVLSPPVYLAFSGILDEPSPILACPSGRKTIPFVFPQGVPPGSSFAAQAFVLPASPLIPPALTQSIVVTVS